MKRALVPVFLAVTLALVIPQSRADLTTKAAREALELLMKKFGKEVAEEGAEKLTRRLASAAARHGDDVIVAVRKVGPKALNLADEAGEHAPHVLRFLSHHGDDGLRVLSQPRGLALFTRYGDDAAKTLIKHKGVAEPLLENLGQPAVKALQAIGPQNGRRLAMMSSETTPEMLSLIGRYGDPAMEFIWKHKAALAATATMAAFLANPEPFLNGTANITHAVSDSVVKPAVTAAGHVIGPVIMDAAEATRRFTLWAAFWLLIAIVSFVLTVRFISKSGILGKLIVRMGFRLAGGQIVGAFRKK